MTSLDSTPTEAKTETGLSWPIAFFMGLDLLCGMAGIILCISLLAWAAFPFSAIASLVVLLFVAHFTAMFQALRKKAPIGYFDHLFTYLILFLWLTLSHTLLFAPFLVGFVYLFLRPGIRSHFGLRPRWIEQQGIPEAVVLLVLIPLASLVHVVLNGSFPILGDGSGLLAVFTDPNGKIGLLVASLCLLPLIIGRFRVGFFLAPLLVIFLYFPWFPLSVLPGAIFLALWFVAENRRYFRIEETSNALRAYSLLLWVLLLGWGFSLLPVGTCQTHHCWTYLYQAWESPLIRNQIVGRTAYSEFHAVDYARFVRVNCPRCEFAHVYRVELAVCKKQRTKLDEALTTGFGRPLAGIGSFTVQVASTSFVPLAGSEIEPAPNPMLIPIASLSTSCPLAKRLKFPGLPYRFEHASGAATLEGRCPTCEEHAF